MRVVDYGVTEDRLSGETLRVGVLFADSEAGRKKVPGVSEVGVSPWFLSCGLLAHHCPSAMTKEPAAIHPS